MNLLTMTSAEVKSHIARSPGVILPIGSIEQHGPTGLVGTDALCAEAIASEAGRRGNILVAPTLNYAPAQFNMAFSGTISIRVRTLMTLIEDIVDSLHRQRIRGIYFLNAHGANLAAIKGATHDIYSRLQEEAPLIRCRSWWDFDEVNRIRDREFGEWEGMHATPSEISITQHQHRKVDLPAPPRPKQPLSDQFKRDHAGDFHPPAGRHKADFPDGRVGADSALAKPEFGADIVDVAADALVKDFNNFMKQILE